MGNCGMPWPANAHLQDDLSATTLHERESLSRTLPRILSNRSRFLHTYSMCTAKGVGKGNHSLSGCRQTLTVPSALAVIISPASVGWCSVQVMILLWTSGGGFGCMTFAWNTVNQKRMLSPSNWRTSTKSQAHTWPFSSPQITVASAWPKQARQR